MSFPLLPLLSDFLFTYLLEEGRVRKLKEEGVERRGGEEKENGGERRKKGKNPAFLSTPRVHSKEQPRCKGKKKRSRNLGGEGKREAKWEMACITHA
jgi:hypothetical protein